LVQKHKNPNNKKFQQASLTSGKNGSRPQVQDSFHQMALLENRACTMCTFELKQMVPRAIDKIGTLE